MQRITQFDGLYGQANSQRTTEYLFSERLETRSRRFEWVIQPHLHAQLFQLFYLEQGQVTFLQATGQSDLTAPVVLLIPATALHGFTFSPDATGHILTLSSALVDGLFSNTSPLAAMLGAVQCLTVFDEPYSASQVGSLLQEVDHELFDTQPEKRLMLHLCLQRLFVVLFRIWQQSAARGSLPDTPALRYFRKFQQLVRQVGTTHTIVQFAADLAITPVHLNRICQEMAGKSASQLVQEHILDEARKYLLYSTYSVSEITYLLHFEYPNYFAKFFKKHTGISPTEFREAQQQASLGVPGRQISDQSGKWSLGASTR
ncbi:helix-turn-helix domain-containing protein [uncultured Hymenobacter sp.]|uniref:helix-turn-helix domain-containing protein n=1 Tax=uncultured Hymenobacter sp. TaxID=170016 RepID=UPI0035CBFF5E